MTNQKNNYAIGIDLGTTYSCVAVLYKGHVEILTNDQGKRTTPSYVAFNEMERLIGDPAKRQVSKNPQNTIFDAKRLIGRRFDDPMVQEDIKHWPFIVKNVGGMPIMQAAYKGEIKTFTPVEISAMILMKMKETAEAFLGTTVKDAVITVPAYFNDPQRQATIDAGAIAGLNVLRIINEPTAAALAYGLQKNIKGERNVLIYDLGGGTFDVTILTITEGSVFKVKATSGDTHLGGQDFDRLVVKFLTEKFNENHNKDIGGDSKAVGRLRIPSEDAKLELSAGIMSSIDIDSFFEGIDFRTKFSREQFNHICLDLFKSTLGPVKQALADAKLDKNSIHDIVLVGGSTRIPKVQELLREFFVGKVISININPDEAVAYGAAVQAAIISGDPSTFVKDVLLVDVTPLSLGIETKGALMSNIIERNTQIPYKQTKRFVNSAANQTEISIDVYEGERPLVKDNNFLGKFILHGVPPKPVHENEIDVTFELDANSILNVSALETSSGVSKKVTIRGGKSSLSSAEINRMRCEAERYKEEDKKELERVTERNNLEFFIHKAMSSSNLAMNGVFYTSRLRNLCNDTLKWIEANQNASKEEYERKKNTLNLPC